MRTIDAYQDPNRLHALPRHLGGQGIDKSRAPRGPKDHPGWHELGWDRMLPGTRFRLGLFVEKLFGGASVAELIAEYPSLGPQRDLRATGPSRQDVVRRSNAPKLRLDERVFVTLDTGHFADRLHEDRPQLGPGLVVLDAIDGDLGGALAWNGNVELDELRQMRREVADLALARRRAEDQIAAFEPDGASGGEGGDVEELRARAVDLEMMENEVYRAIGTRQVSVDAFRNRRGIVASQMTALRAEEIVDAAVADSAAAGHAASNRPGPNDAEHEPRRRSTASSESNRRCASV